jgi:hypothetical protein
VEGSSVKSGAGVVGQLLQKTVRGKESSKLGTYRSQLVDGLDRVSLGTNCANNRGSAVVLRRCASGIEVSEPGNPAASSEQVILVDDGGLLLLLRDTP